MIDVWKKLSPQIQGVVLLLGGFLLLLNTLGVRWVNLFILVGAICMILLGLLKLDAFKKINALMKKKE